MRKFLVHLAIVAGLAIFSWTSFGGASGGSASETRSASGARSAGKIPTFTLNQAILTALQQNPTLLNAEQEINRSRGVIIQVRAQALPQVSAQGNFEWIDPNLTGARVLGNTNGTSTTPGTNPTAAAASLMEGLPSQVG